MKRTKTHTGTFHCPSCFIEVELVNEESLKCDRCRGPLAAGNLDEVWADEDAEEDEPHGRRLSEATGRAHDVERLTSDTREPARRRPRRARSDFRSRAVPAGVRA